MLYCELKQEVNRQRERIKGWHSWAFAHAVTGRQESRIRCEQERMLADEKRHALENRMLAAARSFVGGLR